MILIQKDLDRAAKNKTVLLFMLLVKWEEWDEELGYEELYDNDDECKFLFDKLNIRSSQSFRNNLNRAKEMFYDPHDYPSHKDYHYAVKLIEYRNKQRR